MELINHRHRDGMVLSFFANKVCAPGLGHNAIVLVLDGSKLSVEGCVI